jgi:hypothetical protein
MFRVGEMLCSVGEMVFSVGEMLFSVGEIMFSVGEMLCSVGEMVFSVGEMLFLKEVCTSGRKCPRNVGKSTVDAERLGRASRSSSDEKLEDSGEFFLFL